MKIKKIAVLLTFFALNAYGALEVITVSPYIDKGVSLRLRALYNDLAIIHYYESRGTSYQLPMFANAVYLTPYGEDLFNTFIPYIVIGDSVLNMETTLMISTGLSYPFQAGIFRMKFNVTDKGENVLFKNLAVSPFFGIFVQRNTFAKGLEGGNIPPNSSTSILLNMGGAFGTRYIITPFSYFELFTSPQISFTYYSGLGGGMYDPAAFAGAQRRGQLFNVSTLDLSLPLAFGLKRRRFVLKSGVALTTALGTNTTYINRRHARTDKIVVHSNNFLVFGEIGIHFRQFRKLERGMKGGSL